MLKKALFFVGPALGHISRSLVVARALRDRSDCRILFLCAEASVHCKALLLGEFDFVEIKSFDDKGNSLFASSVEKNISQFDPNIIFLDLTPLPWLRLVHFPGLPTIYLTNFFLTELGKNKTIQDKLFLKNAKKWNAERELKGMPHLSNGRSLYEKTVVLLCDPPYLVNRQYKLPAHYHLVGPCFWNSDVAYPDELHDLDDTILISLGSTGVKPLPIEFVENLADTLNISTITWVGRSIQKMATNRHICYKNLPIQKILPKSSFVITQGGAGSTYQALMYGRAIGVWPSHINQQILGRILEDSDAGVLLESNPFEQLKSISTNIDLMSSASRNIASSITWDSGPEAAAKIALDLIR